MYSVCFLYSNGDGGNITTLRSAGDLLSTEQIDGFFRTAAIHPGIALVVTGGAEGAHLFWEGRHVRCSALRVPAACMAGAGDCLLGTLLTALVLQIPLYEEAMGRSPALELAAACAAMKVTALDSIHFGITAASLSRFLREQRISLEEMYLQRFFG